MIIKRAAKAIITDLLTTRADRDKYYYGGDELYTRHPEIIQRLFAEAAGRLTIAIEQQL